MQKKHLFAIVIAMICIGCLTPIVSAHNTCVPPVASWSQSVTSGESPLKVKFTSTSTGTDLNYRWSYRIRNVIPSERVWVKFSTSKNPSHTFKPGQYDINLTVSNGCGTNSLQRSNWIRTDFMPKASFTATPRTGTSPLVVQFRSTSVIPTTPGEIIHHMWKYRNATTDWKIFSEATNPKFTFYPGVYDIDLMETNDGGSDHKTKYNFIVVTSP